MKILHINSSFKPAWETGGPARSVYELSKKMVEKGHEVTVFTTDRGRRRVSVQKNQPVIVDAIRVYYFSNISNYLARKEMITTPYYLPFVAGREIKHFDIIHIHEYRSVLVVIVHHYAKKYNIPYIIQARGSILPFFQKQRLKRTFDVIWGNRILKDASKAIAFTKIEAEQYKSMGVSENKIEVVPNGINLSQFEDLPDRGEFRRKYGLDDNQKLILYLGRIHKTKGLDLLAKAFAGLSKELDDAKLLIVGADSGYLPAFKRLTVDLEVSDKVLTTGPLFERDKLEAYVDADVHVLFRAWEPFGLTLLEAMACGTPVICSEGCGIADVINGQAGLAVPYDKEQLQHALLHMLSDDKIRRQFGEKGKLLVREKFSLDKIAEQVESSYESCLLSRHQAPRIRE